MLQAADRPFITIGHRLYWVPQCSLFTMQDWMHVSKFFFRWLLLIWALSCLLSSPQKGLVVGLNFVALPSALQAYNKEMVA